jgi:hypothetical protein
MLGGVEGSRSAGLPRAKPKGVSFTLREFEGPASSKLVRSRNQSGFVRLGLHEHRRLCSTHVSSRICSNSLKTNDGRHVYPSQNREDDFPSFGPLRGEKSHSSFFALPDRSKLARGSSGQEPRSQWLAHHSR